ncbi:MAG: HEAT repeat domain-containing protein [Leptolyngbyaceae cyanobacterium]
MTDTVSALIEAVNRADSATGLLDAVEALAAVPSVEVIDTLIEVLGYNNPGAAVAAVDGLVAIGEPAVLALLEQFCGHNYTARSWAIRALAGIGDPRGLPILLTAGMTDFSFSVRRSATKGLGTVQWQQFLPDLLPLAQQKALEALITIARQDEEWVVRYAAIVGLQAIAPALQTDEHWTVLRAGLEHVQQQEADQAVLARAYMALDTVKGLLQNKAVFEPTDGSAPLEIDWNTLRQDLGRVINSG